VLIIIIIAILNQAQDSLASQEISRRRRRAQRAEVEQGLARLREEDPGFEEQAFLSRVTSAFLLTQQAWSNQRLDGEGGVRAFLSDGVYERFSLQFGEQKMLGYRNVMDDVRVISTEIVQVELEELFVSLAVRVYARARDRYVSLEDGRPVPGPSSDEPFSEIWTFQRRRGVKSNRLKPGLIEGNCPNCGANIWMNQNAACASCSSLLRSGMFDWVLTEITQESEWKTQKATMVPGYDAMRIKDPGFSLTGLEDSASVMFWRLMDCSRVGKVDPIHKVATQEMTETLRWVEERESRQFWGQVGVGSVQSERIVLATREGETNGWDRALVRVKWSGVMYVVGRGGVARGTPNGVTSTLLLLARRSAARTNVDGSISSAHCPNCGAPQEKVTEVRCGSCGMVLNDGSHWLLARAEGAGGRGEQELRSMLTQRPLDRGPIPLEPAAAGAEDVAPVAEDPAPVSPKPGGMEALAWSLLVASSDGSIGVAEQSAAYAAGRKWGIRKDRVGQLLEAARHGTLEVVKPRDLDEARAWLDTMADMALADGRVSLSEERLMLAVAEEAGMSEIDVRMTVKRAQSRARGET
jgi:uncharacterized tellurite resistance protein B-like protein